MLIQKFNILAITKSESLRVNLNYKLSSQFTNVVFNSILSSDIIKNQAKHHIIIFDITQDKDQVQYTSYLKSFIHHPGIIFYSAIKKNLAVGFSIAKYGVASAITEEVDQLSELIKEIIITIPISIISKCFCSKYKDIFYLLKNDNILTPNMWARNAYFTQRSLEIICKNITGTTPLKVLKFYNSTSNNLKKIINNK